MELHIRAAKMADAEPSGIICFDAFDMIAKQHNFPPDMPSVEMPIGLFQHVIPREDVYTIVAELDGNIVGSNMIWLNCDVAGIGPITVDTKIQKGTVGKSLMNAVIDHSKKNGFQRIRLVQAAYNNLSMALYTKLGFDVQEPLSLINGPMLNQSIEGYEVRQIEAADEQACNNLCQQIHGHKRQGDLAGAIHQKTASLVERDGRITAYAAGLGFWGHAVGETNQDIQALIGAAQSFSGSGILVPTRNGELMRWCLSKGMKIVQPMTLMSYGPYNSPKGSFLPSILY